MNRKTGWKNTPLRVSSFYLWESSFGNGCKMDSEVSRVYWGNTPEKSRAEAGLGRESLQTMLQVSQNLSQHNRSSRARIAHNNSGVGQKLPVLWLSLLSHWLEIAWEGYGLSLKAEVCPEGGNSRRLLVTCIPGS